MSESKEGQISVKEKVARAAGVGALVVGSGVVVANSEPVRTAVQNVTAQVQDEGEKLKHRYDQLIAIDGAVQQTQATEYSKNIQNRPDLTKPTDEEINETITKANTKNNPFLQFWNKIQGKPSK